MNKQFTRMQKLAGIITEGLYTTQMDQEAPIQSEATPNKMKKSELKAKIKEMIQGGDVEGGKMYFHVLQDAGYGDIGYQGVYMTKQEAQNRANELQDMFPDSFFYVEVSNSEDEPTNVTMEGYMGTPYDSSEEMALDMVKTGAGMPGKLGEYDSQGLTNAASVIDYYLNMAYDAGERGAAFDDNLAYKALEHLKEFSDEFTDSTLYEAKKKEADAEEEDVNVEAPVAPEGEMDVTMDVPAGEDTAVDINGDGKSDIDAGSSEAKKAFGDLTDAFQAAKTLGDEKLIRQIANTITYFNKNIILKQG